MRDLDHWIREVLPGPGDHVGTRTVPPFVIVPGLQSRDSRFFGPPAPGSSGIGMFISTSTFHIIYPYFSAADLFHLPFDLAPPESAGGVFTSFGIPARALQRSDPPCETTGRKRRRGKAVTRACSSGVTAPSEGSGIFYFAFYLPFGIHMLCFLNLDYHLQVQVSLRQGVERLQVALERFLRLLFPVLPLSLMYPDFIGTFT